MLRFVVLFSLAACTAKSSGKVSGHVPEAKPAVVGDPNDFIVEQAHVELRPFPVRLALVAAAAGLSTDHPLLDDLRRNHIELGDADYAHGVQPNLVYTAKKLALWVISIRPICASYEMQTRIIGFPTTLEPFFTYTFGRPADETDLTQIKDALAEQPAGLTPEERNATICVALLSSAELLFK